MKEPGIVAVIDGQQSSREALADILGAAGIPTRGYANADAFFASDLPAEAIACVITETLLPGMSGLELQRRLATRPVPPPVIVVTAHGDVPTAVEALRAGALDFLDKPPRPQVLLDRVHEAFRRFSAALERHRLEVCLRDRRTRLTPREREVMDLVAIGYPNKAVARRLGVTRRAVEAYRARVMRKMQAESLPMLVRECVVLTGDARPIGSGDAPAAGPPRAAEAARASRVASHR
jgi:FixJ family two-component response regulator